jgi:hypothetical protein
MVDSLDAEAQSCAMEVGGDAIMAAQMSAAVPNISFYISPGGAGSTPSPSGPPGGTDMRS